MRPGEDRDEGVLQLLKGRMPNGFLDDADFASDGGEQVERPEFEPMAASEAREEK